MTTPTPSAVSGSTQVDIGEWPSMLSLRTFSGQSVVFMLARSGMLIALSVTSAMFGSTLLLVLALTALGIDVAHTALQGYIQVRGLALQRWVKELVAGNLEYFVDVPGTDEISMYGRVLEALRQSLIRSRQLEVSQAELAEELRRNNETLQSTLDRLRTTQDQIVSQQKLAELGELSAGAAHELRNPLQFVQNFSESSVNLMAELMELLAKPAELNRADARAEVAELAGDLTDNMVHGTAPEA